MSPADRTVILRRRHSGVFMIVYHSFELLENNIELVACHPIQEYRLNILNLLAEEVHNRPELVEHDDSLEEITVDTTWSLLCIISARQSLSV